MSEANALLAAFDNKPLLLASQFTGLSTAFAAAEKEQATGFKYKGMVASAFGVQAFQDNKPFVFANGLAFIPVMGVLLNRYNWIGSYASGYNAIRSLFMQAVNDDDVKGIVLDMNSYGGMVQGCFELADEIYAAREIKPSLAIIDANAHSACFALASAATRRVATRSANVGSIGVLWMHVNIGDALKASGVEVKFVYAGKHKIDGNQFEALPEDVEESVQQDIDASYEEFVTLVSRNLGVDADVIRGTEAQSYRVSDAIALGLVDEVVNPVEAITTFVDELSGSTTNEDFEMTDKTKGAPVAEQPTAEQIAQAAATKNAAEQAAANQKAADDAAQATATASATAVTAERERIKGITGCEEAKGRTGLANHIALSTSMSVDEAKAMLAASPVEQAGAAASANPFANAMNNGDNPEAGAGGAQQQQEGQQGQGQDSEAVANRVLGAYGKASGAKFDTKVH